MFKLMLYGIALLIYLSLFFLGGYNFRLTMAIATSSIVAFGVIYYLIYSFKYSQLKEYFWTALDVKDAKFVNYLGHRFGFPEMGTKSHPFSFYWRKENEFQLQRNIALLKCHQQKGEELIKIEKILSIMEFILFSLIVITLVSFNNLT